jgi:hypothetical protein
MISMRLYSCKINVRKTKVSVTVTDVRNASKLTFDVPAPPKEMKEALRYYVVSNTRDFLVGRGHTILGTMPNSNNQTSDYFWLVGEYDPLPL